MMYIDTGKISGLGIRRGICESRRIRGLSNISLELYWKKFFVKITASITAFPNLYGASHKRSGHLKATAEALHHFIYAMSLVHTPRCVASQSTCLGV